MNRGGGLSGGFWIGLHMLNHAPSFPRSFISANRLWNRLTSFTSRPWIMDSGAFTEVTKFGGFRHTVEDYARLINSWSGPRSTLKAAVSQDYMCEEIALNRTGLDIETHQRLTIERYDSLVGLVRRTYVLPVIQGYDPSDYRIHVQSYGDRFEEGKWVGVGSVCKRNGDPNSVEAVLRAIQSERPDLRLHGFGLKLTALSCPRVRGLLHSADSMAWSYAARVEGRDANSVEEARSFWNQINQLTNPDR